MLVRHVRPLAFAATLLAAVPAAAEPATVSVPLAAFEALQQRVAALERERCSGEADSTVAAARQTAPLAQRLDAVERTLSAIEPAAQAVNGWAGVEIAADLLYVGQQFDADAGRGRYANYRLDGSLRLPAGHWQHASGSFFLHARAGQSPAPMELPVSFSGLNASAFQLGGTSAPEDAALTLTEAWYQLDYPLGEASAESEPRHRLSLALGKLDPFVFFDQNAYANDEASQFLSAPLVHNALLDNPLAAQIGTDAYGASPGLRLGYEYRADGQRFGLSWGRFSSGEDADYSSALDQQLNLLQFDWQTRLWGREGNYRVLAFRNESGPGFDGGAADSRGWALSLDQQLNDVLAIFLRHGEAERGRLPFDRSTALGLELQGLVRSRAADRLGLGVARLHTSKAFRAEAATIEAFGYAPSGAENLIELYYRYALNGQLQASLHLQHLREPGANAGLGALNVVSLRLGASY